MADMSSSANRLGQETSPYLLQHKDNPVHWQAWGAEALARAMERLPPDYRQVITLRHEQQLTFEEIGQQMQRTANAARMLWLRAIECLQKEMGVPP